MGKNRKAVSYLVSIVLMTLIAVALSTLLYAYFSGWIGQRTSATGPVGALSIDEAYSHLSTVTNGNEKENYTIFILFVRNSGTGSTQISSAFLELPNGTVIQAIGNQTHIDGLQGNPYANFTKLTIQPGESKEINITVNATALGLDHGTYKGEYKGLWNIKLIGDDGSTVTTDVRVKGSFEG
ncbi:MAG: hypothetical protein GSR79_08505 [Desulfurococcales archaeon]|nr:hypothetical protein [Desulfurococcales archaeon]